MASANESPRQKMIGMMYLVLTALLALNVSKEILNAFVIVNSSLTKTTGTLNSSNEQLYNEFDLARQTDPKRVTANWEKAQKVKKAALELSDFIVSLKKKLVEKTENLPEKVADTLQLAFATHKEDNTIPTHLMIGKSEDGSTGEAGRLKKKMEEYLALLKSEIEPRDLASMQLGIDFAVPTQDKEKQSWELYNFYDTPLAASVTILSKLENDVKQAEGKTVAYLLHQYDQDLIKFDTIAPKIIAPKNYILLGDDYSADVFVAAFSRTQVPHIQLQGGDTVPVEGGIGKYKVHSNKEGIFKWNGEISLQSRKGTTLKYPFESEYIVAKPFVSVEPEKMNVLYVGAENPLSISVPGIPSEKVSATISSGKLVQVEKGRYMATGMVGNKVEVTVTATMESGEKRIMGKKEFRVKQLPRADAMLGNLRNPDLVPRDVVKSTPSLSGKYDDNFLFNLPCKVIGYKLTVLSNNQVVFDDTIKGNKFNQNKKVASLLSHIKANDKVLLSKINGCLINDTNVRMKFNDIAFKVN